MARSAIKPRTVAVDVDARPADRPRHWHLPWPWYVTAGAGPATVLLAGWLILSAVAALGWLTSPETELRQALLLSSRLLVLANGGPVDIGGLPISVMPLGLTLLLLFLAVPVASFAARQAAGTAADTDDTGRLWVDGEAVVLRVAGVFAGLWAACVLVLAAVVGSVSPQALLGGLTLGAVAGLWGASRGVGFDPTRYWPAWLRVVPRAIGAALLIVVAGGAALLSVALFVGRDQVTAIAAGLEGGTPGVVVLTAAHLAYLPNFVLACVSWILGAGVTVGEGSLLTMSSADAGLLPAVPIFEIVPAPDSVSAANLWWLVVGVLAGAVAAAVVTLARPRARFDETAVVGGLSGVVAGFFVVVACALGSGGLGVERLAVMGARIPELAVFAPSILGLSGMATGLVLGLVRRPGSAEGVPQASNA